MSRLERQTYRKAVMEKPDKVVHMFADLPNSRPHILQGTICWCRPERHFAFNDIIVHRPSTSMWQEKGQLQ